MERHIPIDETYCPFSRAVLCKTKMEDLSVVLFGEDSEESEIFNELVEESDELLLLGAAFRFMRGDLYIRCIVYANFKAIVD